MDGVFYVVDQYSIINGFINPDSFDTLSKVQKIRVNLRRLQSNQYINLKNNGVQLSVVISRSDLCFDLLKI